MKKTQLRFNVINALPDDEAKTKLLQELLQSSDMQPSQHSTGISSANAGSTSRVSIDRLICD